MLLLDAPDMEGSCTCTSDAKTLKASNLTKLFENSPLLKCVQWPSTKSVMGAKNVSEKTSRQPYFKNFPGKHPIPLFRRGVLLCSILPHKAAVIVTRQCSYYFFNYLKTLQGFNVSALSTISVVISNPGMAFKILCLS